MSAVARRVQKELLGVMRELTALRIKSALVNKRINLSYEEGFERGAAGLEEAKVLADDRMSEIIRLRVERDLAEEIILGLRDQLSELWSPTLNWLSSAGLEVR